jgi:hypothetical protein
MHFMQTWRLNTTRLTRWPDKWVKGLLLCRKPTLIPAIVVEFFFFFFRNSVVTCSGLPFNLISSKYLWLFPRVAEGCSELKPDPSPFCTADVACRSHIFRERVRKVIISEVKWWDLKRGDETSRSGGKWSEVKIYGGMCALSLICS